MLLKFHLFLHWNQPSCVNAHFGTCALNWAKMSLHTPKSTILNIYSFTTMHRTLIHLGPHARHPSTAAFNFGLKVALCYEYRITYYIVILITVSMVLFNVKNQEASSRNIFREIKLRKLPLYRWAIISIVGIFFCRWFQPCIVVRQ